MAKFAQGIFIPKNTEKLLNNKSIIFRSSWENTMCHFFDQNPSILQWSSESIQIPYQCPFTGKRRNYIPDFFVIYQDKDGIKKAEIIEVKPYAQTGQKKTKSPKDQAAAILNAAKWNAAAAYCSANGVGFKILTENEIFRNPGKKS